MRDTAEMEDRNVLGGRLEPCGNDPVTGFFRDGCCHTSPEDRGSHTICAVVTPEFLQHQQRIGNDLITPMLQYGFPGLVPGDRWCVTAANWLRAHNDRAAARTRRACRRYPGQSRRPRKLTIKTTRSAVTHRRRPTVQAFRPPTQFRGSQRWLGSAELRRHRRAPPPARRAWSDEP